MISGVRGNGMRHAVAVPSPSAERSRGGRHTHFILILAHVHTVFVSSSKNFRIFSMNRADVVIIFCKPILFPLKAAGSTRGRCLYCRCVTSGWPLAALTDAGQKSISFSF